MKLFHVQSSSVKQQETKMDSSYGLLNHMFKML